MSNKEKLIISMLFFIFFILIWQGINIYNISVLKEEIELNTKRIYNEQIKEDCEDMNVSLIAGESFMLNDTKLLIKKNTTLTSLCRFAYRDNGE